MKHTLLYDGSIYSMENKKKMFTIEGSSYSYIGNTPLRTQQIDESVYHVEKLWGNVQEFSLAGCVRIHLFGSAQFGVKLNAIRRKSSPYVYEHESDGNFGAFTFAPHMCGASVEKMSKGGEYQWLFTYTLFLDTDTNYSRDDWALNMEILQPADNVDVRIVAVTTPFLMS